jgi:threonine/homoserine/homoserine lactone efflux protein
MSGAFIAGVIAGYGVAIPVGAIAILIIDAGIRRGWRVAFAAGAGAATADGFYAALAALAGAAIAAAIAPYVVTLRWISVAVLVAIAARGLLALRHEARSVAANGGGARRVATAPGDVRRTYLRFLGLTIVNPATVIYFAALILGLPSIGQGPLERVAFVLGALLASLSWQSFIGSIGALAHGRLPPHARLWTSLVGNLLVLGFAANIARGLLFP